MLKAIFWDNDGVIVDTEKLYFRATKTMLAEVGIELTEQMFIELYLTQASGAWHLVKEKGYTDADIVNFRNRRNAEYGRLIEKSDVTVPGVKETLERLKNNFLMAIVTTSNRQHFDLIHKKTGLLPYFDFVLTRENYRHSKPDPEPYLLALQRANVTAAECLVIEDSARGIRAAKAAGMTCWVVATNSQLQADVTQADKYIGNICDLPELLLPDSFKSKRNRYGLR
jgi:HAD superfamily hydrolase (TIGR01509 family)